LGIPRPQIGGAHNVGGVLRLVFGLLEIGRIASPYEEQAYRHQSGEANETNSAHIAGRRSSSQTALPFRRKKIR
jgi:hypothetical protein